MICLHSCIYCPCLPLATAAGGPQGQKMGGTDGAGDTWSSHPGSKSGSGVRGQVSDTCACAEAMGKGHLLRALLKLLALYLPLAPENVITAKWLHNTCQFRSMPTDSSFTVLKLSINQHKEKK